MTRPSAGRGPMRTVPGSPWAVMLRHAALPALIALLAVVALAAAVDGADAAGSAGVAGAAVLAPFAATGLILWAASRVSPQAPALAMVSSYVALVLLGAVLLAVVTTPAWIRGAWVLAAAVAQVVVWLAGTAAGLRRARLPVYDLPQASQERLPRDHAGSTAGGPGQGRGSGPRRREEHRS